MVSDHEPNMIHFQIDVYCVFTTSVYRLLGRVVSSDLVPVVAVSIRGNYYSVWNRNFGTYVNSPLLPRQPFEADDDSDDGTHSSGHFVLLFRVE